MSTSIIRAAMTMILAISEITVAASNEISQAAEYIASIERYDVEAWAQYDSIDRYEVTSGTDRGAQLYVYRQENGHVQRVIFDYGLSQSDTLYYLLYKDSRLVKATQSRRKYQSGKNGEMRFCLPYPQAETNRIYFKGSEAVCLSSNDKTCEAVRRDNVRREAILKGASDLLRNLSVTEPETAVPDVDFLKFL